MLVSPLRRNKRMHRSNVKPWKAMQMQTRICWVFATWTVEILKLSYWIMALNFDELSFLSSCDGDTHCVTVRWIPVFFRISFIHFLRRRLFLFGRLTQEVRIYAWSLILGILMQSLTVLPSHCNCGMFLRVTWRVDFTGDLAELEVEKWSQTTWLCGWKGEGCEMRSWDWGKIIIRIQ